MEGVNLRSSRPATSEEDGVDQIAGFETPRSGVATPQPDLHDKRLPGIMSYFNQVRSSSFQRFLSGPFKASGQEATVPEPTTLVAGDVRRLFLRLSPHSAQLNQHLALSR